MRVHIGSDHAGFELKNHLVRNLTADGHDVVDHGPESYDAEDDYPTYCIPAAEATAADPDSLGIVVGGSGNGEQMAANKVEGDPVRARVQPRHRHPGPRSTTTPRWSRSVPGCTARTRPSSWSACSWPRRSARIRGTSGGSS